MGQRGPIRDPNSRRGRAEILKRQKLATISPGSAGASAAPKVTPPNGPGELPTCDKCLPRRIQEIYQNLVIDLAAARVPIKQIDSHAITMAARCLDAIEKVEQMTADPDAPPERILAALRMAAGYGKDLQRWLELICATPGARARIGVKGEPEKKAGPLAQILAMKQRK
jgi:hypothetical protein